MGHDHAVSAGGRHQKRLLLVLGLTTTFLIAEVVGGLVTGSLALLADAAHMMTDVFGLGLALVAIRFAARPATNRYSYGFYRIEILAATFNGALLLGIGAYILVEAIRRLIEPREIEGGAVMIVAAAGLVVNLIGAALLRGGAEESLNVQGAFLEVLADLLGSIAVLVSGGIILFSGWQRADPIASVAIGLLVIPRTLRLLKGAVDILLEGSPAGMDVAAIEGKIMATPGVESLHDLHVWTISSGLPALSAHVLVAASADRNRVLEAICADLTETFDLHHTTIQIEGREMEEEIYHAPATPTAS